VVDIELCEVVACVVLAMVVEEVTHLPFRSVPKPHHGEAVVLDAET